MRRERDILLPLTGGIKKSAVLKKIAGQNLDLIETEMNKIGNMQIPL